ncbi:nucleoside hydrolase [bacterium]|nr:nucleoside hydrolase [bacterium]
MEITSAVQPTPQKMLVVSDIGRDQDDETTLVALGQLVANDQVSLEGLVANLQPSDMRARLAKGVLKSLAMDDVPVAVGSAAGQANLKPHAHEFDATYIADSTEVENDGQALLKRKLEESKDGEMTLLLISGMTDCYELVHNSPELAKQKLGRVVIMGGVTCDKDQVVRDDQGYLTPDSANNNTFDMPAAKGLYRELQDLNIPMTVVTKTAAYASAVGKQFYEDLGSTGHAVGQRLRDTQKDSLDGLWHRANLPADDPERGGLPARCDRSWFLTTFCSGQGQDVPAKESIWGQVTQLNLYDAVAMLVAARSDEHLFSPTNVDVKGTQHQVIGISKANSGVADAARVAARLGQLSKAALEASSK